MLFSFQQTNNSEVTLLSSDLIFSHLYVYVYTIFRFVCTCVCIFVYMSSIILGSGYVCLIVIRARIIRVFNLFMCFSSIWSMFSIARIYFLCVDCELGLGWFVPILCDCELGFGELGIFVRMIVLGLNYEFMLCYWWYEWLVCYVWCLIVF